jgi:hypothetical protein
MATSILDPGFTAANSTEFTVADGAKVLLSIFTDTGVNMPSGPVLSLQRADINGNFINVSTVGYGRITFTWGCQQLTLDSPGTYRVSRPDITAWGVAVGVQSE